MFKTGELSKVFEIDRTSLNYYVKTGLLDPEVQDNQYHNYSFHDVIALSYIRYYRGLGFKMNQIKQLTQKATHQEKITLFDERLNEISKEIRILQMKQRFLEHFKNSVLFHKDYPNQPMIVVTQGYYFVRKEDIEDPVLIELYKLTPSNEFEVVFDDEYNVTMESVKSAQGLALKEEWVKEFDISLPKRAIYYPPKKKCICSYRIKKNGTNEELEAFLAKRIREIRENGYDIERNFIIYLLMNQYHTEEESFDIFAQFALKSLD